VAGPRDRLEPFGSDRAAASDAGAERALIEAAEGGLDLVEVLLVSIPKGEVSLLLEDLASRRCLGPVGHGVRRHDPDRDLGAKAIAFGGEDGTRIGGLGLGHREKSYDGRPVHRRDCCPADILAANI
jgi:hypothetical protein